MVPIVMKKETASQTDTNAVHGNGRIVEKSDRESRKHNQTVENQRQRASPETSHVRRIDCEHNKKTNVGTGMRWIS